MGCKEILNFVSHLRFVFNPYLKYKSDRINSFSCINGIGRKTPIILSLTSSEDNFADLDLSLYSLMTQTIKPDKIILWLSDEYEFSKLPYSITRYVKNGLEIRFVKFIEAYTKLIYALKNFSDCIVVTADSNIIYPANWLEKLYVSYVTHPKDIQVHTASRVKINQENGFAPFVSWKRFINEESARYDNFAISSGGILYPPQCFNNEVFREDIYLKKLSLDDDIWLWVMAIVSGRKIRVVKNHMDRLAYTNVFGELKKLYYQIGLHNKKDKALRLVEKYYGSNFLNKLLK